MALYLGDGGAKKIILNGVVYRVNFYVAPPVVDVVKLISIDNYELKDINGLCLSAKPVTKPSYPDTNLINLKSLDDYILKDLNGLYLTIEEVI